MKCNFYPETYKNQPIGMFHCPECGVMVLAGLPHPDICDCSGEIDYKGLCYICNPNWDKDLK